MVHIEMIRFNFVFLIKISGSIFGLWVSGDVRVHLKWPKDVQNQGSETLEEKSTLDVKRALHKDTQGRF